MASHHTRSQRSKATAPTGRLTPRLTPARHPKPTAPKDYPLWWHPSGRWCRKVRGRAHYFGSDPDAALALWLEQKDDLLAGRTPRATRGGGITVADLANHFLDARHRKMEAGELDLRTWQDYKRSAERIIKAFGRTRVVDDLRPEDFSHLRASIARQWKSKAAVGNEIQRIRTIFKYGYDNLLLDRPVRFGTEFQKPSAKQRRQDRNAAPAKMLSAEEIRKALNAAPLQLKAMILLGINAGFGNTDCATLPMSAVDFKRAIVDYARPKTAVIRRATLWPETVKALQEVLAKRYEPVDEADKPLLFITKQRHRWSRLNGDVRIDSVAREFGKLLRDLGIKRRRVGFYSLRHTFETIAGETGDQAAVDRIMGHERPDMATQYREWLRDEREDDRLRRVTDHVRQWLFGDTKPARRPAKAGRSSTRSARKPARPRGGQAGTGRPVLRLVRDDDPMPGETRNQRRRRLRDEQRDEPFTDADGMSESAG